MSPSRGLLSLTIATLTLPIQPHIKNSLCAQGWNPLRSLHECLSLVSPDFFQPSRFQLRWKTSEGWKKWAIQFSLHKSTGVPLCKFPVSFEFEFVLKIDVLNLNLHFNSEPTYYIFLGVRVRQKMTSPRASELSLEKELPVIFLSIPARELATIHILLP